MYQKSGGAKKLHSSISLNKVASFQRAGTRPRRTSRGCDLWLVHSLFQAVPTRTRGRGVFDLLLEGGFALYDRRRVRMGCVDCDAVAIANVCYKQGIVAGRWDACRGMMKQHCGLKEHVQQPRGGCSYDDSHSDRLPRKRDGIVVRYSMTATRCTGWLRGRQSPTKSLSIPRMIPQASVITRRCELPLIPSSIINSTLCIGAYYPTRWERCLDVIGNMAPAACSARC